MVNFIEILDGSDMRGRDVSLPSEDFDTANDRNVLVLSAIVRKLSPILLGSLKGF